MKPVYSSSLYYHRKKQFVGVLSLRKLGFTSFSFQEIPTYSVLGLGKRPLVMNLNLNPKSLQLQCAVPVLTFPMIHSPYHLCQETTAPPSSALLTHCTGQSQSPEFLGFCLNWRWGDLYADTNLLESL